MKQVPISRAEQVTIGLVLIWLYPYGNPSQILLHSEKMSSWSSLNDQVFAIVRGRQVFQTEKGMCYCTMHITYSTHFYYSPWKEFQSRNS